MQTNGRIDYLELCGAEIGLMKRFYGKAFGWRFEDFGPSYAAFEGAGLDGGVAAVRGPLPKPLVILYAEDLEGAEAKVVAAGGEITRPIFAFPGGRRFHFSDPAGNELGVWSKI